MNTIYVGLNISLPPSVFDGADALSGANNWVFEKVRLGFSSTYGMGIPGTRFAPTTVKASFFVVRLAPNPFQIAHGL